MIGAPTDDPDFIHIPRPRSIVRGLLGLLALLVHRSAANDRGATITTVTDVLSASGRSGTVVSHEPGGEWSVTVTADPRTTHTATTGYPHNQVEHG